MTEANKASAPASAWYALAVLVLTTLFAFVDKQILTLIAPSLQQSLGFTDLQLGALQGLGLAIFASIASYPFGWLADRFGRRLILAIGAAIWSLSTAACAFQNDFTGLFIGTIGVAVGEAGLGPVIFAMIPDLFPKRQRSAANFIYFGAALLGGAIGLALGGITLGWIASVRDQLPLGLAGMDPWRVALLLVATPGPIFVALILSIRTSADGARRSKSAQTQPHHMMPVSPFARANWKTLACVLGAVAAYSIPLNSTFVWLPVAVPRVFGIGPAAVGVQMGIALGIGTIIGLALPAVGMKLLRGSSPLKPVTLARWFMLVAILPTLSLLYAAKAWQVYAAAGGQLTLALACAALMPGILQNISPRPLRARILAMLGIISGIAAGLAPLLVGAVSGLIEGPRGILAAIVIVGLPGWMLGGLLLSLVPRPFIKTVEEVAAGEAAEEMSVTTQLELKGDR